jgi:hypothetical protein
MKEKQNFCFETLKSPLAATKTGLANAPADKAVVIEPSAERGADLDADRKDARTESIRGTEVEVEIRYDKPTEAERKAVENFFDWLLAQALSLTGEIDKAA